MTRPTGRASPYAGLVTRLAALVVDVALLTGAGLAVSVLPGLAWDEVLGRSPDWVATISALAAALLPWLYFTLSWWLGGRTGGAMLLGLVVRDTRAGDAERHGEAGHGGCGGRVSLVQAGLRAGVGLLLAPLWLVGLFGILRDQRRRAWHDRLFRTVVCYAPTSRRS